MRGVRASWEPLTWVPWLCWGVGGMQAGLRAGPIPDWGVLTQPFAKMGFCMPGTASRTGEVGRGQGKERWAVAPGFP